MSKRKRFHLFLLAALLLGPLLMYVLSKTTRYEETVEHGPAPEARSNPYLAAERFLINQGRVVTHAEHLGELADNPPNHQVLLMLDDRTNMTPDQTEALLQWVEAGGHLVVVAERIWDEKAGSSGDLLLDALNLQQYETPGSPDDTANRAPRTEPPALTRLFLENEEAPAYIAFDTDYHLYDAGSSAFAWANSDRATHMLQLRRGSGLITALTDSWIWQNEHIGRHDHAWLLWYLTQDRDVTLTYRTDHEGLVQRLLRYFPEALTALLLMVLITLWHVGQRQGPLIEATPQGRRQLREHLRGSADFLYRRAGQGHLLNRLQHDIHRQAQRRYPGFESLGHAEQCQVLATLSQTSSETVAEAMRPAPKRTLGAAVFTRQVACLHSLRNAL